MKNVRKLGATVILTLVLSCSTFAGIISSGVTATNSGDPSGGIISSGITSTTPQDTSSETTTAATGGTDSTGGIISSGLAEFLSYLSGTILS